MLHDLTHSLRALMKRPGFTLLAVLCIALGIGLNTAMFTIVNSVLWKPFPYPQADRLVRFNEDSPSGGLNNSAPNAADWKARSKVLEDIALYRFFPALTLRLPEGDQSAIVAYTYPSLFRILRVQPAAGRVFSEADNQPSAETVVVISNHAWEKYFGRSPSVLGSAIRVSNGTADHLVVIGIMPPGFSYETVDFWLPLGRYPMAPDTMRANHWFAAVGRLSPGVSLARARQELSAVSAAIEKENPQTNKGVRAVLKSMSDYYAGRVKTPLLILFWAVAFVMLIACGNVVHLVMTRTLSRGREIAVRMAMGATSLRLVRLLLSEGLVLSVAGGAVGLWAAQWVVTAAIAGQPGLLPEMRKVSLDSQAVLYAAAATLFTALLLAVIPVWRVSKTSVLEALQAAGRGGGDGRRQRLGWIMIAGEIAMASVLLAGAGMMVQALANLSHVNLGYQPDGLLSMTFVPPAGKTYTDEAAQALLNRVLDSARSVPGYRSASLAMPFGVGGNGTLGPVVIPGRTNPSTPPLVPAMSVTPEFFETMHIPLLKGRTLSRVSGEIPEAVVNQEFVRRFLADENPIGRRVSVWDTVTIVGVVGNSRLQSSLPEVKPEVYLSGVNLGWGPTLLLRVDGGTANAAAVLRQRVKGVEPGMRGSAVRTLTSQEESRTVVERFTRGLLLVFALLATVLACLGVYGVASYSVAQRTREIGIRMAVGASRSNVVRLVFRQTLLATLAGSAAGIAGAAGLSRLVQSQLYGVGAYDPAMILGVLLTLLLVTAVACLLPLRRASKVDPAICLRQE